MSTQDEPARTLRRLVAALNDHDLEAFVACFHIAYKSEQPVHPDREFTGREQVRRNWSAIFAAMPDLHVDLQTLISEQDTAWVEMRWTATQSDGSHFDWRGVCLFGVKAEQIVWGRLYMEPVEEGGGGIDAAVGGMTAREP